MGMKIIPIVLSGDDNYAPMMATTIYSLLENASENYFYEIYVLHTDLAEENREKLLTLKRSYSRISFLNVSDLARGIKRVRIGNLTIEAIYRLLIPELLPQYEKILYLDSDLIVLGDISELYMEDMGDSIIGAAHQPVSLWEAEFDRENLKISVNDDFNSGVLLINTKRFIEDQIKDQCLELLKKDWNRDRKKYIHMDNDVLMITCKNHVKFIPMKWNVIRCFMDSFALKERPYQFQAFEEEFKEACADVKILHYAGNYKPWDYPKDGGAETFWTYAGKTCFYIELVRRLADAWHKKSEMLFSDFNFPYKAIPPESHIILYGAGKVGQSFNLQLGLTKYCDIALWVDKNYKEKQALGMKVDSPEEIRNEEFDYILIAIIDQHIVGRVKEAIVQLGVPEEKIICME